MGGQGLFSRVIVLFCNMVDSLTRIFGLSFNDIFCFLIIIVAVVTFRKYHKAPKKITKDLRSASEKLEGLQGDFDETIRIISGDDDFWKERLLKQQWEGYVDSLSEIEEDEGKAFHDIQRFFNQRTLIELPGKRRVAEIVPGILTALGILGTFMGLLVGVIGLETASTEALRGSIGSLLNGMSVAFASSIAGIVGSIVWSSFDRKVLKDSQEALDDFLTKFEKRFPSPTRDSVLKQIEKMQREQTEAMKTFATDVSVQFANALNDVVQQNIMPAVDSMSGVIGNFASVATENQTDGLRKVVDEFTKAMNESLKGQFENLGDTIKELCEWQLETKRSLDGLIEELKETTLNQKELNVSTEEIIMKFSEYFSKLVEANGDLMGSLTGLQAVIKSMDELYKNGSSAAESIKSRNDELQASNQRYFDLIENNTSRIKQLMSEYSGMLRGLNKELGESGKAFAQNLNNGLTMTFSSFDKNLSQIANRLSGTIEEIRESVDLTPETVDLARKEVESSIRKMDESVKRIDDSIAKIPQIINKHSVEKTA